MFLMWETPAQWLHVTFSLVATFKNKKQALKKNLSFYTKRRGMLTRINIMKSKIKLANLNIEVLCEIKFRIVCESETRVMTKCGSTLLSIFLSKAVYK